MSKVAAIIAWVAAPLIAVGVTAVVATVVATVAVGVVLAAGATAIANKMAKSMTPELGTAAEFDIQGSQGIMVNKTGSSQTIPVVYGSTRTGGIRVFAEANDTDNKYLHLAFVLSEGEINKMTGIYFDGVLAGSQSSAGAQDWADGAMVSPYNGLVKVYFRPGTDTQTEISGLAGVKSGWDPHFKGIAYVYVRLEYDEEVWTNGVPQMTFDVEGKKVPSTSDGTSLSYDDNPARCILDMLVNTRYGKGIDPADLDLTSFASAETYCNTKGFELRGNVSTNGTIYANLIDMLTSCRGYIAFGNQYRLLIDKIDTTDDADIFAITKDNIIGNVDYVLGDKRNMFNKMTAKFLNSSTGYKDDIVVIESSTLKTQDNELSLEAEIPLPFTKTKSVVEQILTEEINQSRQSHMIQVKCTVDAIDLQVGDLVKVTNETFGITEKKFRVMSTIVEPSSEVTLSLREYDADVYSSSIITDARADDND
jgi:hypothetical protein